MPFEGFERLSDGLQEGFAGEAPPFGAEGIAAKPRGDSMKRLWQRSEQKK